MATTNIQTIARMLGELIENIMQFFINMASGYYLLLFGFFAISIIYLIFYFFEEIIEWFGRMTQ